MTKKCGVTKKTARKFCWCMYDLGGDAVHALGDRERVEAGGHDVALRRERERDAQPHATTDAQAEHACQRSTCLV